MTPRYCPTTWGDCLFQPAHVCEGGRGHEGDHRCACGATTPRLSAQRLAAADALRPNELACEDTIVATAMAAGWQVHAERASLSATGKHHTAIKGQPGYPDLTLIPPARWAGTGILFVELKRWPNTVEAAQAEWHRRLRLAGHTTIVLWVPEEQERFIGYLCGGPNAAPWWGLRGERDTDRTGVRP